jgi:hypothetical protein
LISSVFAGEIHTITGRFDLLFAGDAVFWKQMSENRKKCPAQNRLRHQDRHRAWPAARWLSLGCGPRRHRRQISHKDRNNVLAAYIQKAELIEERRLIMNWWSRDLGANRQEYVHTVVVHPKCD